MHEQPAVTDANINQEALARETIIRDFQQLALAAGDTPNTFEIDDGLSMLLEMTDLEGPAKWEMRIVVDNLRRLGKIGQFDFQTLINNGYIDPLVEDLTPEEKNRVSKFTQALTAASQLRLEEIVGRP